MEKLTPNKIFLIKTEKKKNTQPQHTYQDQYRNTYSQTMNGWHTEATF